MFAAILAVVHLSTPWSIDEAHAWGQHQKWRAGCNFIPKTAINQLEMWQADTFDAVEIDTEMALMQRTGMSVARIFLHDLAYGADPAGFKTRMKRVLRIAKSHDIKIIFVFFDDCWKPDPTLGKQPSPIPGVHNSGWVRSPGDNGRTSPEDLARLKFYVQDVVKTFRKDATVWMWDLFNEPGNSGYGETSLPLLRSVFDWAREIRPSQPLTAGSFGGGQGVLDRTCLELSDVVTFHCYDNAAGLKRQIQDYKKVGRPVICTEWMARTNDSRILSHLPIFHEEGISCCQWGFVSGKTNTIFPWGSQAGTTEPKVWFHDLYRPDGAPFDPLEIAAYQRETGYRPAPKSESSVPSLLPVIPNRQGVTGLRLLADMPLRDPSICSGPDGWWYLTGTVEPFYGDNQGIKIWKSKDLRDWKPLGMVWKYGQSPWHKPYAEQHMSLWAPEIHYYRHTFFLTYSMPGYDGTAATSGSGLLMSTSGQAEGPYVDIQPDKRMGDEIDASLFEDTDGKMYFLWHSGKIARLRDDLMGLAEPYHWLRTSAVDPNPNHHSVLCEKIFGKGSYDHIGYEGMFIIKREGTYYVACSESIDGRYSCMIASSKSIYGPYSARYEAIPHGGHNVFFQDEHGVWWSTIFGSDGDAPWQERPGIVPIAFGPNGQLVMDNR